MIDYRVYTDKNTVLLAKMGNKFGAMVLEIATELGDVIRDGVNNDLMKLVIWCGLEVRLETDVMFAVVFGVDNISHGVWQG